MTYRTKSVLFYAGALVLLVLIVFDGLSWLLPGGVARQIGHNSESLCFALLVCAFVQFGRPATSSRTQRWAVGVLVAVAGIVAGYLLLHLDLRPSIVTLNEPVIAAGVVVAYVQLGRPLRWPLAYSTVVLAFVIVFFDTDLVLDQAESLVLILLAPIGLDVMDRFVLEGHTYDSPVRRGVWCAALVGFALAMMALAPWARDDLEGGFRLAVDYAHRAAEAYWGWLLVHLYFSYWLGRRYDRRWVRTSEPALTRQ